MTLKEKFKKIDIKLSENHSTKIVDIEAIQCEKIADDYAIDFADWLIKRETKYFESLKALLQLYKKEKGL